MSSLADLLTCSLDDLGHCTSPIDVAVVGSGTAGTTTAIELARQGLSVVILEAGPFLLPSHVGSTPFRSRDDITPEVHNLVRYRTAWVSREDYVDGVMPPLGSDAWSVVGGRTLFWGGCAPRFAEWDFDDWPIDAATFRPYYERAEALMHVSGRDPERPAFFRGPAQDAMLARLERAGIPGVHAQLGVDTQEMRNGYVARGFDCATDRLLRSALLSTRPGRGRVVVVPEAVVEHIETDRSKARGLVVRAAGSERRYRVTARHYVLAGGAVQSTRLALASGLGRLHPCVGRYLSDHLFVQGLLQLEKPLGEPIYVFVEPSPDRPFHVQVQGAFQETWYSPYHATVWLDCDPQGTYLLVYAFGVGTPSEGNELLLLDRQGDGPSGLGGYCVVADYTEQDRNTLDAMYDYLEPLAAAMGGRLVRRQVNPLGAALHEIGGLRMGRTPDDGVTDLRGRFWALKNLSVADAAAWPSQGSANSYLTITAWSLRHAEGVANRLADG